jgi:APA family basic amino acid/polyamine antiporter
MGIMELKRTLNLFDAISIGIGAIVGAGIFVVVGIAIGYAGPAIVISIIIAAIVASFTALSFAELGSAIPKQGGVYAFAYEIASPSAGFVVGYLWLFAQTVAGAAISLGFAGYFVAVFPFLSLKAVAVSIVLALTALNLVGIKQSAMVNNALVLTKIAIICLFIVIGIPRISLANYSQFAPNGFFGVLQGAGFIFFAFLGFGRIAMLGEEVRNPNRTLPLSILLSFATSAVIYVLTGLTATGLQDYRLLAQSNSPIADAAGTIGAPALVGIVSFGALVATVSVLLTTLIGLSRVSFAMARNGQIPKAIAKIHPRFGTPYVAILIMGTLMAILALAFDLRQTSAITSFSILSTHVVLNYCAIKLRKKIPDIGAFKAPLYPLIPSLGVVSCLILLLFLPVESWLVSAGVLAALVCWLVIKKYSIVS